MYIDINEQIIHPISLADCSIDLANACDVQSKPFCITD
jgi:hypothetical protein